MTMVRFVVCAAFGLSVMLAVAAGVAGAWALVPMHLFVAGALAWGYLRPMNVEVERELMDRLTRERVEESIDWSNIQQAPPSESGLRDGRLSARKVS